MIFDFLIGRIASFKYAFEGIAELLKKEKNTRIHLFFTVAAIAAGFIFKISPIEFCIIILTISSVWCAEAMNTAVERAVDLVTHDKKPLAKASKDLAAGAVLITAIGSIFIGLIIFLPKFIALFH